MLGPAGGQRAAVGCEWGGGKISGFTCGFLQGSLFGIAFFTFVVGKIPVSDSHGELSPPRRLYLGQNLKPLGCFPLLSPGWCESL